MLFLSGVVAGVVGASESYGDVNDADAGKTINIYIMVSVCLPVSLSTYGIILRPETRLRTYSSN